MNVTLYGNRFFANVTRVRYGHTILELALIHWSVSYNNKRGNLTQKHREKATWWWKQKLKVHSSKPRTAKLSTNFQNLEEAKKDPLLQASERTQLCQYFHFKLPASQNLERINFCSLKSLVSFSVPRKLIQVSWNMLYWRVYSIYKWHRSVFWIRKMDSRLTYTTNYCSFR